MKVRLRLIPSKVVEQDESSGVTHTAPFRGGSSPKSDNPSFPLSSIFPALPVAVTFIFLLSSAFVLSKY